MTDVLKLGAQAAAQELLGPTYEVKVSSTQVDKFDLLEFLISRASRAGTVTEDQAWTREWRAPVPFMQRIGGQAMRKAVSRNRAAVLKRDCDALKAMTTGSAVERK